MATSLNSQHDARFSGLVKHSSTYLLASMISILIILLTLTSVQGFDCLSKCDCFYKSNKLIADCGSRGFTAAIPEEDSTEKEKSRRTDIQVLNLTRNTFSSLKSNIFYSAHLVNLQRVYLKKVGLESVEKSAFFKLTNLVELDLSSNSLKNVPSESFSPIMKLRELDLSENLISEIYDNSFASLPNLKTLNLERNVIKTLGINSFVGLIMLNTLKLSDNQISVLDSMSLNPLERTHSLKLSGNPWNCDCRLRQLREYLLMSSRRMNVIDEPTCSSSKVIWTQLDLNSFICPPVIVQNQSSLAYIDVHPGKSVALECAFYMTETQDLSNLPIKWIWQDRDLVNGSKGLANQKFTIKEFTKPLFYNSTERKMKVSRLEVSFVLEMNQGPYTCISENKAGRASTNFTLNILPGSVDDTFPSDHHSSDDDFPNAEASQNSHGTKTEKDKNSDSTELANNNQFKNNNNNVNTNSKHSIGTESMVYGLIIGILVGIVLVLVTLSAAIVVMCRKKSNQRSRISSSSSSFNTHHSKSDHQSTLDRMATLGLATESELEKLTPSSLSTSSHVLMMGMIPSGKSDCSEHESSRFLLPPHSQHDPSAVNREMMFDPYEGSIYGRLNSSNGTNLSGSVINPVQKPPRIGFGDQIDVPAASTPQVWLIKRSNTGSNFDGDSCSHASCYGEEGNGSVHCGTPLPYFESNYDTATLSSTMTNCYMGNTLNNGPDLIHHPVAALSMHDTELSLSPSDLYASTMRGMMVNEESRRNADPSSQMRATDEQISLAQVEGTIV